MTTDQSGPRIHAAVIPAAGLGLRMRGADPSLPRDLPKELYPVAGMPAIFHGLLLAMEAGVSHVAVVLRSGKDCLRRLVSEPRTAAGVFPQSTDAATALADSLTLHFCYQEELRGECYALAAAWPMIREHAAGSPVAVLYPDNIVTPRPGSRPILQNLAAVAAATGLETVALMDPGPKPREDISDSGRVDLKPWDGSPIVPKDGPMPLRVHGVTDFLRKGSGVFSPRFSGELRTCGVYVATERWFAAIDDAIAAGLPGPGEELTDGVVRRRMVEQGELFAGVEIGADVYDVGNPTGYRNAVAHLGRGACRSDTLAALCGPAEI